MEVIEIVTNFLKSNKYTGLFNSELQCGCSLRDGLEPCGEMSSCCEAGYLAMCTADCQHEGCEYFKEGKSWHIQRENPRQKEDENCESSE